VHEDGIRLEEVPRPAAAEGEVLVRVHAAAITRDELEWPADRLPAIPSYELSGVTEDGEAVIALTPFDRDGCAAEWVAVPRALLAPKPAALDHVTAAALPMPGLTAWQGLFGHGALLRGERVLVRGASGGVGHIAVQLARWAGAEVVDGGPADLVFDTAGNERPADAVRYVTVVADTADGLYFVVEPRGSELAELARLADERILQPQVDSVFGLTEFEAAYERCMSRGKRGKVVLRVDAG
jgi:NADPH:quinone reductase-like Zn-dependent oxidoreductase